MCSHSHLFTHFLSIPNPLILSSNQRLLLDILCTVTFFYTLAHVPPPSLRGHIPLLYLETPTLLISWSNVMSSVKSFLTSQPGPHLCFYAKVSIIAFSMWSGNYLLTPVFLTSQGELAERSDQRSSIFISQNSVQALLLLLLLVSCFSRVQLCATPQKAAH